MEKLMLVSFCIFVLCIIMSGLCHAQDDDQTASPPMKSKEKYALYSSIQGFVGKWWNGSDLYPDPCGWTPIEGVSCDLFDGFWYVTELSIGPVHDNSLTCARNVEFNSHLFALKRLKTLSFFNCFVSPRQHPVSIPIQNWEVFKDNLESLEFRSNPGLMGKIPHTFGELKNLQSLVITENGLSGELPHTIGNLTGLKRLNLAGNSFNGEIPYSIGGLNSLLILDMSRNSFSGVLPSSLGSLTSLLKLDLSSNHLQGKIPQEIGNLNSLTLLDLSNNVLSGGLSKPIEKLSKLQDLVLSNNPIGGDIKNLEWDKLSDLTAIGLTNTSLTGGIPESITRLEGLRFLGLSDNKLTGYIPMKLMYLPNISTLYVHGNNLSGELGFSEGFYGKMGRRFGAWDNPNLCYPMRLVSNVPFGVKRCDEDKVIMRDETNHDSRSLNHDHGMSVASYKRVFSNSRISLVVFLVLYY